MKINKVLILFLFIIAVYGCKKDLGNYNYNPPVHPTVRDLDGNTFPAIEGDSLILNPPVDYPGGNVLKDLTFTWRIDIPETYSSEYYTGYPLRIIYNLPPQLRVVKLTVKVKSTGIEYYYNFRINGVTQFSLGTTILSVQNGVTKLSFVQPDNKTIQSDIYTTVNNEALPVNPIQLYAKEYPPQTGTKGVQQYWITSNDHATNGVIVDATTMLKVKDFTQQFFSSPAAITSANLQPDSRSYTGTTNGVINNKLYIGTSNTYFEADVYGKFGNAQPGNYTLSPYFTQTNSYFFGYDTTKNGAFVSFDAGGNFNGSDYQVNGTAFDPTGTGMHKLLFMKAVSGLSYAFLQNDQGTIYELSFMLNMDDYNNRAILPLQKRVFAGASLIQPDTKWQKSQVDIFYFTSNNAIYRYNPLNQQLKALNINLGGKKITMLKLSDDDNTLIAGVDGSIYFIDVSVGKDGSTLTKPTITGIPGTPVDMVSQLQQLQ